jgi:uncharacterized protein DUF6920
VLAILGRAQWKRQTAREVERLSTRAGSSSAALPRYDRSAIAALPAAVVRYFDFALTQGQPVVTSACIEWEGRFSMRAHRWSAFTATQHYHVQPPGFVWDARIWMTSVVPVLVRDSYAESEGSLKAAIGGIVKVADASGTADIAKGELLRYLGEAVWFPTALLPTAGVSWTAVDDDSATATLSDGATTVSLDAHFGDSGEIVSISAMRPREMAGRYVLTPWVAHLRSYTRRHGMMVPESGDVEWQLPSGPLSYWQGRVVSTRYDFTR